MSRVICSQCQRPQKVCICDFIKPIVNGIEIGILQHPSEVKQIKGTAIIAIHALSHCQYWVGESVDALPGLVSWLQDDKPVLLLYPETENQTTVVANLAIDEIKSQYLNHFKVLILDGTWRKTFKMMQINPSLNALPRIALTPKSASGYQIRKQKDEQSLSTIEAIYELLSQLENSTDKYQPLLTAFEKMQQQQLAFRQNAD
ncbi:DTW domain-containing protein [Thiomicrorhabdus immobilis]|uniref:tRNA-uridine aminocarboxypropyltransferase n=1 Tax=Thiomicrorhabdus immobilis TaxID=2791037 RepID=A0ABN6CXU6_9GAMM|nr:tRNA-uridine aminocarboxypropyltransferase [Thiomicrorhabdus immobilis]BCN93926.1 DTW domain-containing protein [Thiomicrorhabdus immobilis]